MNNYRVYHGSNNKSCASNVRRHSTSEIFNEVKGSMALLNLPGEITFQWKSNGKRRGDINSVTSYWPVVSNKFKEFVESKSFSGVAFHTALDIPTAPGPREEPLGPPGIWWVMTPTNHVPIDMDAYCGQNLLYDEKTTLLSENYSPGRSIFHQRLVVPLEEPTTDFFGIANMVWHPSIYCNERTMLELKKMKFINLVLEKSN